MKIYLEVLLCLLFASCSSSYQFSAEYDKLEYDTQYKLTKNIVEYIANLEIDDLELTKNGAINFVLDDETEFIAYLPPKREVAEYVFLHAFDDTLDYYIFLKNNELAKMLTQHRDSFKSSIIPCTYDINIATNPDYILDIDQFTGYLIIAKLSGYRCNYTRELVLLFRFDSTGHILDTKVLNYYL